MRNIRRLQQGGTRKATKAKVSPIMSDVEKSSSVPSNEPSELLDILDSNHNYLPPSDPVGSLPAPPNPLDIKGYIKDPELHQARELARAAAKPPNVVDGTYCVCGHTSQRHTEPEHRCRRWNCNCTGFLKYLNGEAAIESELMLAVRDVGDAILNDEIQTASQLAEHGHLPLSQARRIFAEAEDEVMVFLKAARHEYMLKAIPKLQEIVNDPKSSEKQRFRAGKQLEAILGISKKNNFSVNVTNNTLNTTNYDDFMRKMSGQ